MLLFARAQDIAAPYGVLTSASVTRAPKDGRPRRESWYPGVHGDAHARKGGYVAECASDLIIADQLIKLGGDISRGSDGSRDVTSI